MAYSLITNTAAASGDSNNVTTSGINTTGADLLVVLVTNYTPPEITGLTDSKGNTWTPLTTYASARNRCFLFYTVPSSVGAAHTFTWSSLNNNYPMIFVQAWSGAHATPFDQQNGNNTNGVNSTQPGSITPSENNCLVVTGVAHDDTVNTTIDGGFTISNDLQAVPGFALGGAMAYLVQTTASAANPTWSYTSDTSSATIASFKAAAGAPPEVSRRSVIIAG